VDLPVGSFDLARPGVAPPLNTKYGKTASNSRPIFLWYRPEGDDVLLEDNRGHHSHTCYRQGKCGRN